MLWPHQLFVGHRDDLDGLLCQPEEELASRSRLSPVETEDEFVEVVVEVLVTDSSLMGSEHPSLEQRDRSMDSGQQVFPIVEAMPVRPISPAGPPPLLVQPIPAYAHRIEIHISAQVGAPRVELNQNRLKTTLK
jgi:hypothetical protein